MKSYYCKMMAIVAGFLMIGSLAYAGSATVITDQNQSLIGITLPDLSVTLETGEQNAGGKILTIGDADGSFALEQDQQRTYGEVLIDGADITAHYGTSDASTKLTGDVKNLCISGLKESAETKNDSTTVTVGSSPDAMVSSLDQKTSAAVKGGGGTIIGKVKGGAEANASQEDGYVAYKENSTSYTLHMGDSKQTVAVDGGHKAILIGGSGYKADALAVQSEKTITTQNHGHVVDSMTGGQKAVTMTSGSASDVALGIAGAGSDCSARAQQTHVYEQGSYNPATGTSQYQTGEVTTRTSSN